MQIGYNMIKEGLIGDIQYVDVWSPGKNDVPSPVCHEVPVPPDFDFRAMDWTLRQCGHIALIGVLTTVVGDLEATKLYTREMRAPYVV